MNINSLTHAPAIHTAPKAVSGKHASPNLYPLISKITLWNRSTEQEARCLTIYNVHTICIRWLPTVIFIILIITILILAIWIIRKLRDYRRQYIGIIKDLAYRLFVANIKLAATEKAVKHRHLKLPSITETNMEDIKTHSINLTLPCGEKISISAFKN